jgi:hypothetical protein
MFEYDLTMNKEAEAHKRDCDIVYPKPNELFIDIDSKEEYAEYRIRKERLARMLPSLMVWSRYIEAPSRSGGDKLHCRITLSRNVTVTERLCLQAVLGSDPVREMLNIARLLQSGDAQDCLMVPRN